MRLKWVMTFVSVAVLTTTAGVALAAHAPQVDPATVPTGFLATHKRIADVPVASLARAVTPDGAEVSINHTRLAPGAGFPWHTHPGPVLVTIVSGSVTYEYVGQGTCQQVTYTAGEGFSDPGFGHVHRAFAGAAGADVYAVYILPPGSENLLIPVPAPAACS